MTQPAQPIWKSIANTLVDDIGRGHFQAGDKLPSEAVLAARFGVNRHTVRRAIRALVEDGLVHTRRGSGAFVLMKTTDYAIGSRVRFHQNLAAAGRIPGKNILSLVTRNADETEAENLALSVGEKVHVYDGLSLADGVPIALFCSVFPAAPFPDLCDYLDELRSVTSALKKSGVKDYTRISTRLTARPADAIQAQHLNLPLGAPLLRSESVNADEDGRPIEFGMTWFAGDRITLTLDHNEIKA